MPSRENPGGFRAIARPWLWEKSPVSAVPREFWCHAVGAAQVDPHGRVLGLRDLGYRGTSLVRNRNPLGPHTSSRPGALRKFWGGGRFLVSEVPLYKG